MTPTPHTAWRLALGLALRPPCPFKPTTPPDRRLGAACAANSTRKVCALPATTAARPPTTPTAASTVRRYSQNVKLGVQFDLGKLYGFTNGDRIQLTINDRRGNSASEDLVGNRLPIQENYGGLYTRLTELSYERTCSRRR